MFSLLKSKRYQRFQRLKYFSRFWGSASPPPAPGQDDILAVLHSDTFYAFSHPKTSLQLGLSSQHSSAVPSPSFAVDVTVEESTSKKLKKQQEAVQERRLEEESSPPPFPPPQGLEQREQRVTGGRLIPDPSSSSHSSLQVPSTLPELLIDPL